MSRSNEFVARSLRELAELMTLAEGSRQAFRVRAYERAADAVRSVSRDIADLTTTELQEVDGIGAGSARKIEELVDTGTMSQLEELRERYPPAFVELLRIPGVGPKTALALRDGLGVETVDDLRVAVAEQRLRELPGLGPTSEEKIARSMERLGLHGKDRRSPINEVLPVAEAIVEGLRAAPGVAFAEYCGSLRRFRETIGDLDILVSADDPSPVAAALVDLPEVDEVVATGDTKTTVLTRTGLQVDLRVVAPSQRGAALVYFTGSKEHNIQLRQRAIGRGLMLNEYGLSVEESGTIVAGASEEEVYSALDLAFVPPELREGLGEVDAAAENALPELVELGDLRGDLHVHSTWSGDGRSALEDMIAAAAGRGLEYVAITEHGEDLAINGLSRDEVLAERDAIAALRDRYPEMAILHGAELNIGPDGGVDYDAEFLDGFDWCVASVHSHFDLPQNEQTERVVRAIQNPAVNAIGHLTGRRVGRRPGIDVDFDAVCSAAIETETALEINSNLDRLDVPADLLRRARHRHDLLFAISTDAHHTSELAYARFGVQNARRGWVTRDRVTNTWPRSRFLKWATSP